jgi:hypothetical protein
VPFLIFAISTRAYARGKNNGTRKDEMNEENKNTENKPVPNVALGTRPSETKAITTQKERKKDGEKRK